MSQIRQTILGLLSRRSGLSADAIARSIGLSKMAARYHLRLLARDKLIIAHAAGSHNQVGRPETTYALTERAYDCLPCRSDELVVSLLESLMGRLGERETRTLLRHVGRRKASQAFGPLKTSSIDARLSFALRFLHREGYACRADRRDRSTRLIISNCPYRKVAQSHPQVCEMDLEMVRTLLGVPASLTGSMAGGQGLCQFVISKS